MIQKHIKINKALSDKVEILVTEPFGLSFSEYVRGLIVADISQKQALRAQWDRTVAEAIHENIEGYDNADDSISALRKLNE